MRLLPLWAVASVLLPAGLLADPPDSSEATPIVAPPPPRPLSLPGAHGPMGQRQLERWGTAPTRPTPAVAERLVLAASRGGGPACSPRQIRRQRRDASGCTTVRLPRRHWDGMGRGERPRRFASYDGRGCAPRRIKHYSYDHVSCTSREIRHARLDDLRVPCNPNDAAVRTPVERFGAGFAALFTDTRVNCELSGMTSPIAIGDIVETKELGRAVVLDYVFAERIEPYIEWRGTDIGDKGVVRQRRTRGIVQLVVQGTKTEELRIVARNLTFSTKAPTKSSFVVGTLSPEETKEIMIRRMIERGQPQQIVRVYPEERKNYDTWLARYPKRPLRERDPSEWDRSPAGRKVDGAPRP